MVQVVQVMRGFLCAHVWPSAQTTGSRIGSKVMGQMSASLSAPAAPTLRERTPEVFPLPCPDEAAGRALILRTSGFHFSSQIFEKQAAQHGTASPDLHQRFSCAARFLTCSTGPGSGTMQHTPAAARSRTAKLRHSIVQAWSS